MSEALQIVLAALACGVVCGLWAWLQITTDREAAGDPSATDPGTAGGFGCGACGGGTTCDSTCGGTRGETRIRTRIKTRNRSRAGATGRRRDEPKR